MPGQAQWDESLSARVLLRTLEGVEGLEAQLEDLRLRYAEREDVPGVALLLRCCSMLTSGFKQLLIEDSRRALEAPESDKRRERRIQRAQTSNRPVELDGNLEASVALLRRFEDQLRLRLELISEIHGQPFDAISGPYRRLAKALPGDRDIEIIFKPSPATLYEIWFKVLDDLRVLAAARLGEDMAGVFDRLPRLMAIEYPWHYERDTFMHAVIAHEIGHIAFVNNQKGDQIWLDTAAGRLDTKLTAGYRRWFIEFACDMLACRMLGPAYAIALIEHTLGQNIWFEPAAKKGGTSHPPLRTRVRKMEVEVARFFQSEDNGQPLHDSLKVAKAVTDHWMKMLPDDEGIPGIAEPVIDDALEKLGEADILGEAEYAVGTFRDQIPAVWSALTAGVAPAEIVYGRDREPREATDPQVRSSWSEPCDWRSILNGGYLRWLAEDKERSLPDLLRRGSALTNERIERCAHIQGSIELSELHRAMLEQHKALGQLAVQIES